MNPDEFQVLAALKQGTKRLDEIGESVGVTPTMEFVDRLFLLARIGWVSEDNRAYSLTPEGAKRLDAQEHLAEDTPKLSTMELGRRPDEPSQTSSSAPVPHFRIFVDRFGNPGTRPLTQDERRAEENKVANRRMMLEQERRIQEEVTGVLT
jgi:hypothetical protein